MAEIIELRRTGGNAVLKARIGDDPGGLPALPMMNASVAIWRQTMAFWGTLWLMPLGLAVEVASRERRRG